MSGPIYLHSTIQIKVLYNVLKETVNTFKIYTYIHTYKYTNKARVIYCGHRYIFISAVLMSTDNAISCTLYSNVKVPKY